MILPVSQVTAFSIVKIKGIGDIKSYVSIVVISVRFTSVCLLEVSHKKMFCSILRVKLVSGGVSTANKILSARSIA